MGWNIVFAFANVMHVDCVSVNYCGLIFVKYLHICLMFKYFMAKYKVMM